MEQGMITPFKGEGMYVLMYIDRETEQETREPVLLYTEEELKELTVELQEQYENVEIYTLKEAEELELYNCGEFC